MSVIPALWRQKQEEHEFEASLGCETLTQKKERRKVERKGEERKKRKEKKGSEHQWFTPVILATQEAKMRITV
jgi:hypothetical protein